MIQLVDVDYSSKTCRSKSIPNNVKNKIILAPETLSLKATLETHGVTQKHRLESNSSLQRVKKVIIVPCVYVLTLFLNGADRKG